MLKNKSHMFPWFLHVKVSFRMSNNCSWRFGARDISINAPRGATFTVSYSEK